MKENLNKNIQDLNIKKEELNITNITLLNTKEKINLISNELKTLKNEILLRKQEGIEKLKEMEMQLYLLQGKVTESELEKKKDN